MLLLVEGRLPALASRDASCGGFERGLSCFVSHRVVIGNMPLYIGQTEQRNTSAQHKSNVVILIVNDGHRDARGDEKNLRALVMLFELTNASSRFTSCKQ